VNSQAVDRLNVLAAREKGEPLNFGRRAGRLIADYATRTVYKYVLVLRPRPRARTASACESSPPTSRAARVTGWFEFVGNRRAKDIRVVLSSCAADCDWDSTWSA